MKFLEFWRVFGTGVAVLYTGLAFKAGVDGDRFSVGLYSLIAAPYYYGAAKSHAALKRARPKPPPRQLRRR